MNAYEWSYAGLQSLLDYLKGQASERKLRLFAAGCARRFWTLLEERVRQGVELAERCADGQVPADRLAAGLRAARSGMTASRKQLKMKAERDAAGCAYTTLHWAMRKQMTTADALRAAQAAQWAAGHLAKAAAARNDRTAEPQAQALEQTAQTEMIHCLFGNPFRPVVFDPAWRTAEVRTLAQTIYDDRDFGRMKRLATVLGQAGCKDKEILAHCRHKGEHVRGCWVVDLLLEAPSPVAVAIYQGPSLDVILREVSEVNLHGRPVPPVLRALWEAQLAFEDILRLSDCDAELFYGRHEAYEQLYLKDPPDKKMRGAYQRMFQQIGFIAYAVDPQMFGYWFYDDQMTVERAPIVTLNSEGTFKLCDANLQDYLLLGAMESGPENVRRLRRWFKEHDIPLSSAAWFKENSRPRPRFEWDALHASRGLPHPDKRLWEYING
jgi:hypothetical protein